MTVTSKVLVEATLAATGTIYTATNVKAIVDKFTVTNQSTTDTGTISVYIGQLTDTPGSANTLIVNAKTLQPYEDYTFPEIVGHNLANGDYIYIAVSGTGPMTVRSSGREIT